MTMMEGRVRGGTGGTAPLAVDPNGGAIVSGGTRQCVGRTTIPLDAATPKQLSAVDPIPAGATAALIQADGGSVRVRLDANAPAAGIGHRIDDGAFYPVDTPLADVRLVAQAGSGTVAQVVYFDRP